MVKTIIISILLAISLNAQNILFYASDGKYISSYTQAEIDSILGGHFDTLWLGASTGYLEYHNDRLYLTNVATPSAVDRTRGVISAVDSIVGTDTEDTLWVGTLEANALKEGNVFKIEAMGSISNASASDDITIRKYIGSTLLESINIEMGNVSNADWHLKNVSTVHSVGANGVIAFRGEMSIDGTSQIVSSIDTINTTIAEDIIITAQWDKVAAGNKIYIWQGFMELKN